MNKYKKAKYFKIYELVGKNVYNKYGEDAWKFIDAKLIDNIDWLREKLNRKITANTYYWGGRFNQRGLRHNLSAITIKKTLKKLIYLSAHILGKALDFDVEGMTAKQVRDFIKKHQKELPHPCRLEEGVTWVHMDVIDTGIKVYIFKP